jgi:hypothetical protein
MRAEPTIVLELSRTAALKLMFRPVTHRAVNAISNERYCCKCSSGLTCQDVRTGITHNQCASTIVDDKDVYVIRRVPIVEKSPVAVRCSVIFARGSYFGEMADRRSARTATVKAAISEVVRFPGEAFVALLDRKPSYAKAIRHRREVNSSS